MNNIDLNIKIVERIKRARIEANKTQKDLADILNKTPAAISDMERGKVQVSAGELYLIAKLLDRPIEYFYGEDMGNNEIQEILAMLRELSRADIRDIYQPIKLLVKLKDIENISRSFSPNQKIPSDKLIEFYNVLVPLTDTLNQISEKVNKIHNMLHLEMQVRKLKTPK